MNIAGQLERIGERDENLPLLEPVRALFSSRMRDRGLSLERPIALWFQHPRLPGSNRHKRRVELRVTYTKQRIGVSPTRHKVGRRNHWQDAEQRGGRGTEHEDHEGGQSVLSQQ